MAMLSPTPKPLVSISDPAAALELLERALNAERRAEEAIVVSELRAIAGEIDEGRHAWLRSRRLSPFDSHHAALDRATLISHVVPPEGRHVMLEDPIPAGAEQLESVGNLNLDYANASWTDWYSSREFRDRRTVFFFDQFDGEVKVQYALRVQVPGEFNVAPARAELMYEPSTYANTSSGRFVFLDRKNEKAPEGAQR